MGQKGETNKRQKAFRRGIVSEYVACFYLLFKGYRILALRYKTRHGEIDIIARKGDLTIFVEVKARATVDDAVNAVSAHAAHRIRAASDHWLSHQADSAALSQRYDIVAVRPWSLPVHLQDAF